MRKVKIKILELGPSQDSTRYFKIMIRWVFVCSSAIALFWGVWYAVSGVHPVVKALYVQELSRFWDVLIGAIWSACLVWLFFFARIKTDDMGWFVLVVGPLVLSFFWPLPVLDDPEKAKGFIATHALYALGLCWVVGIGSPSRRFILGSIVGFFSCLVPALLFGLESGFLLLLFFFLSFSSGFVLIWLVVYAVRNRRTLARRTADWFSGL